MTAARPLSLCAGRMLDTKVVEAPSITANDEATRTAEYRLNRSYIGRFWDWLTDETIEEPVRVSTRHSFMVCVRWGLPSTAGYGRGREGRERGPPSKGVCVCVLSSFH